MGEKVPIDARGHAPRFADIFLWLPCILFDGFFVIFVTFSNNLELECSYASGQHRGHPSLTLLPCYALLPILDRFACANQSRILVRSRFVNA